MQRLEVSGAVRPIYGSLGVKELRRILKKYDGEMSVFVCPLRCTSSRKPAMALREDWYLRNLSQSLQVDCHVTSTISILRNPSATVQNWALAKAEVKF